MFSSNKILSIVFILLFLVLISEVVYLMTIGPQPSLSMKPIPSIIPTKKNVLSITPSKKVRIVPMLSPLEESQSIPTDFNSFLLSKQKKQIDYKKISYIEDNQALKEMKSGNSDYLFLDVRENYELGFLAFNEYTNYVHIRLGDLVNNNFILDKNKIIVVIAYTETRSNVAANYLLTIGYTKVKILKGGLDQWVSNNLPLKINENAPTLYAVLKYYPEDQIKNIDASFSYINFGSCSQNTICPLFLDSKSISEHIDSLSLSNKLYIFHCISNDYCFQAVNFWSEAKNRISIIGYTGYKPQ